MNSVQRDAFAFIDSAREEMLFLWERLVNMESQSAHKDDVDKVAAFLHQQIESFGGTARIVELPHTGNGLVARFGQNERTAPVCFLGHYDTVFPRGSTHERPFRIEDGTAYGPGVLDMKGGVVMQLFAARALHAAGYTDRVIKIVLAGDEEARPPSAIDGMPVVYENECRGAVAAFNFEPGDLDDTLVVGRKGTAPYNMEVNGVASHSGSDPEKGRSAIWEMAHKVLAIQSLTDYEQGVTFNVGTIQGGTARNTVPDHAAIIIDGRVLRRDQLPYVEARLREIAEKTHVEGTTTVLHKRVGLPPMEKTPGNEHLFEYVKAVAGTLGTLITRPVVTGSSSDSSFAVQAGVPTIDQCGVKGRNSHSDKEFALVESLFERTKLAVACVLGLDKFEKTSS